MSSLSKATFAEPGHSALMSAPANETAETPIGSLQALAEAEGDCRRCPLYRDATQAVPGEGPSRAEFMNATNRINAAGSIGFPES